MPRKIEISHRTIIFTVFFLISLWLLYLIRDIILIFFISLVVMAVLDPLVTKLTKFKIPRWVSVLLVYLLVLAVLSFTIYGLVPALVDQTNHFLNMFPSLIKNIGLWPVVGDPLVKELVGQVGNLSSSLVKFTFSAFSVAAAILSVLVITFYLLLGKDKMSQSLDSLIEGKAKQKVKDFFALWERSLGSWIGGQLILMLVIAVLTFIGLSILQLPFAIPLSILAGLLEIVPIIGPIVAAIPAVIIGLSFSFWQGALVAVLYLIVQQLENQLLVPNIMEKSTGIHPVVILLCLAVGSKLAGLIGVLLTIPVYLTLRLALRFYSDTQENKTFKIG